MNLDPTHTDDRPSSGVGSWKIRRRFLFIVSSFCMGVIAFCLWSGQDSKIAETAITMAFLALGTNVGSYVFGAAWDDANARRYGGQQ